LKRRWRNGATEIVFERTDFMAKLAALVPAPRAHLRTFHGILAPAARWRPLIVPTADVKFGPCPHVSVPPESTPHAQIEPDAAECAPRPKNYSWSSLLKRVFDIDVSVCERCGGPVRIIAAIQEPETAEKILKCLALPSRPPPIPPARYERCSHPDDFAS
jgi:hypothetical protein